MNCNVSTLKLQLIFAFTSSVELFALVILSTILQADVVFVCRAVVFLLNELTKFCYKYENIPTY